MANIEVKDIKSNGAQLFDDSEGFMDELNEDIFEQVNGEGMLSPTSDFPIINPLPITRPLPTVPIGIPQPWTPVIL